MAETIRTALLKFALFQVRNCLSRSGDQQVSLIFNRLAGALDDSEPDHRLHGSARLSLRNWVPYVVGPRISINVVMDWTDFDADGQATIMLS